VPLDPADAAQRAVADRAAAARDHAAAVEAYEADLAVARAKVATAGRAFRAADLATLDAREHVTRLAVLLDAIAAVEHDPTRRRDRRIERVLQELSAATAPGTDAVRALLADAAAELAPRATRRSEHRLADASPAELTIFGDLLERGLTFDQLVQLLDGGHLLVPGRVALDRWRDLPGARARPSSHYRDLRGADAGPQYGLAGRFTHEILFGPGPHGATFVQLERAAPSRTALPRHLADWVEYRATHRNQGPYGSSAFTDARPLRLVDATPVGLVAEHVGAIATSIDSRARVLQPELSLAPVVGVVPDAGGYDEALIATIVAFTGAAGALRALAATIGDAGTSPAKEHSP
jgi:hypothetical protein